MYTLRRINSDKLEINTNLNENYVLVLEEKNKKEFSNIGTKILKFETPEELKDIYGFVSFNEGQSIIPLYKKSQYYIMQSDGKTFDNITLK